LRHGLSFVEAVLRTVLGKEKSWGTEEKATLRDKSSFELPLSPKFKKGGGQRKLTRFC